MSYIERHIKQTLLTALKVHPVVFLSGPRQAGKSTLVEQLAHDEFSAEYVSFDNPTQWLLLSTHQQRFYSVTSL